MNTCQVSVTDAQNTVTASSHTGTMTDCSHQRDEIINTQPTSLSFRILAYINLSMGIKPHHIAQSQVGVVGTKVTVVKIALNGEFRLNVLFDSDRFLGQQLMALIE